MSVPDGCRQIPHAVLGVVTAWLLQISHAPVVSLGGVRAAPVHQLSCEVLGVDAAPPLDETHGLLRAQGLSLHLAAGLCTSAESICSHCLEARQSELCEGRWRCWKPSSGQPTQMRRQPELQEGLLGRALADESLLRSFLSANIVQASAGTAMVQYRTSSVHTRRIASGEPGSSRCCARSARELHMVVPLLSTCSVVTDGEA